MPVFLVHDPKPTSPSTSPSPKLPVQTVRRESPGRPKRPQLRRPHQRGAGVWTISVPLRWSRSGESSRRSWRARCPPGRLSRSPAPMPPFRTIVTTSGQRARAPQRRFPVGLGSSRCPARCRGTTDGTGETQRSCTWSLLAASRVAGDTGGHGCLTRAGDVERGFRPRNGPTSTAGSRKPRPDEAVRGASAAGARSVGRMVRRGTSRPGGPPTVPAPRSADLDGRVRVGIKKVI
jgi:hypothetical protein